MEPGPLARAGEDRWPDGGPAWRDAARRRYDAVARCLTRLHVPATLALADVLARGASLASLHGPSAADVAALFDWLPRRHHGPLVRRITALHLRNRTAIAVVADGRTHELTRLVRWQSEEGRRRLLHDRTGTLVAAGHIGAFYGVRAALRDTSRPVFRLADMVAPDVSSRTAALKRAVDTLRDGGVVVATFDGPGGTSTRELVCLGRRIVLRRGPFTLARLTGVPVVPVACAWTRRCRLEIRVATPIAPRHDQGPGATDLEDEMATRAAAWLDAYLRAAPGEIWPSTLRYLLAAPRA